MSRLLSLLPLTLLVACATAPAPQPTPEPVQETTSAPAPMLVPSVVEEIQADIDGAVIAYREALDLIESGSVEAGEALMGDALAGLDDSVNRCRAIPGCDLTAAVTAYQDIIGLQSRVFDDPGMESAETVDPLPGDGFSPASGGAGSPNPIRDFNGRDLVDLIPMNRYVQEAINDWLTWNRPLLMRSYQNYQYLRQDMAPAYEEAGFPEALLFGMLAVESAGKVHAYSRAGAAGPLQFMRATARVYGLKVEAGFDQRLDPARAARANVAYLQRQLRDLDNSLEKTLAAYNAGENRLKRINRQLNRADFWSSEFFYRMPRDTRKYVPEVLAAAWLFIHADEVNLALPEYPTERGEIVLQEDLSLGELAICLGNHEQENGWFRTLRNLNPQVKPGERVPAGERLAVPARLQDWYAERCVEGSLLAQAAQLHDAAYGEKDEVLPYVVQQGDTLGRIARRYRCVSIRELAAMNNIKPPRYLIRAGKTIKVPNC